MAKSTQPVTRKKSERGIAVGILLVVSVAVGVVGFSLIYNLFFLLRENSDQDRVARSAAVVAIKAYVRTAVEPTPVPQRKRITYALDAAARVLNVDTGTKEPIVQLTTPLLSKSTFEGSTGPLPTSPISVTLSDKDLDRSGAPMATAEIAFGRVTGLAPSYNLQGFTGDPSLDTVIGARVRVSGLSRSKRKPLLSGYFGVDTLQRFESEVLVVYDSKAPQIKLGDALSIITNN